LDSFLKILYLFVSPFLKNLILSTTSSLKAKGKATSAMIPTILQVIVVPIEALTAIRSLTVQPDQ